MSRSNSGLSLLKFGQIRYVEVIRREVGPRLSFVGNKTERGWSGVVEMANREHFSADLPDFCKISSRGEPGSLVGIV